ncbi:MAG: ABC transporter substrate-binding protein [candidate division Zixibacteria bacterium]|nr:ABC transporter substrate-binding protein [candidate division Zixibacteria bacterium]
MKAEAKVVLALLTCAAAAAVAADRAVVEDFERAERYYAGKDYLSALRLYGYVLEREPTGPFAAASALRVGMCNFAVGEYAAAADALQKFEEGFPDSVYLDDAAFLAAQAFFRMGEYHSSFERLLRVVSFGKKSRYYGRAVRGLGNLADEALTADALRKRLEDYHHSPEAAAVLLKLAKHEVKRKDYEKAIVFLDEVERRYAGLDEGRKAAKLLASVREKLGREPSVVGVLLPLSGEYQVYGEAMRAAVELAAAERNRGRPDEAVTFIFEDTASTEEGALEAARRLIYGARAITLLGPAFTNDVRALAPLCHVNQVPALSPSATDGKLCRLNDYIYANGLTHEVETANIAEYAVNNLHLKRFAILYPANPYGADLRDAFTEAVTRAGGEVAGSVEYPLINLELKPDKREINYFAYTQKLKWLHADAVYVPGHYEEVVRILPQLTFSDVSAYVLGTNGWNENRVIRVAAKYVEGTYFTAGFFADSLDAEVRAFVANYRRETAEFPNYLAAAAYDAAKILCSVLYPPAEGGAEIKSRLDAVADYPGISGRTTLRGDDGMLRKEVAILTVHEGEVVEAPR